MVKSLACFKNISIFIKNPPILQKQRKNEKKAEYIIDKEICLLIRLDELSGITPKIQTAGINHPRYHVNIETGLLNAGNEISSWS